MFKPPLLVPFCARPHPGEIQGYDEVGRLDASGRARSFIARARASRTRELVAQCRPTSRMVPAEPSHRAQMGVTVR